MRYYICYPPDDRHHGACIMRQPHNVSKRGKYKGHFKSQPFEIRPIGKSEEELHLRWILDGLPPKFIMQNNHVRKPEDLATNRANWFQESQQPTFV